MKDVYASNRQKLHEKLGSVLVSVKFFTTIGSGSNVNQVLCRGSRNKRSCPEALMLFLHVSPNVASQLLVWKGSNCAIGA